MPARTTTLTEAKALPLRKVAAIFTVTPQTIRAWVRAGRFPPPLKIGRKRLFWSPDDIEAVLKKM
jgi:predicted DNA-binding transcriptional regulator AlpA